MCVCVLESERERERERERIAGVCRGHIHKHRKHNKNHSVAGNLD